MLDRYVNITDPKQIMKDLLYLKDDQIKDFIEQIFYAYRETNSDPKKILKKHSFGNAHHRAIQLIERHESAPKPRLTDADYRKDYLSDKIGDQKRLEWKVGCKSTRK